MRLVVLCALCLAIALAAAVSPYGRAEYVGGTVAGLTADSSGQIFTAHEEMFLFRVKQQIVQIPFNRINLLEYGQNVSRRYALAALLSPIFLLSKKRLHFLTVGYTDDEGKQQALVFRVDKRDVRAVLVSLEARTGRRIEYQDEEARKAGKGS
jgi:hypothetical protein